MNRDEQRHRKEGGLVSRKSANGELCFALDLEAGGTWVGLNSHGVAVALLNRYNAPTIHDARSRGLLVTDALSSGDYASVLKSISSMDPLRYNPFDILVVSASEYEMGVHHFSWDRNDFCATKKSTDKALMLTSSSLFFEEVRHHRQTRFEQWLAEYGGAEDVDLFHLEQVESQESLAVLMSRDRTHTKSLVQINMTPETGRFTYYNEHALTPNSRLSNLQPTASEQLQFSGAFVEFSDIQNGSDA